MFKIELFRKGASALNAVDVYNHARYFETAYEAAMRPLTERLCMAQPAVDILLFLANNPGLDTARDICTYRHLKPAIVSFHVDKLVREGYLERQSVPEDRRKCRLVLTDRAASAVEQGRQVQAAFSERLTDGLEEAELEILLHCFQTIEHNLTALAGQKRDAV